MLRVEEGRFSIFKIIILLGKKEKEEEVDVWRNQWDVIFLNHLLFFFLIYYMILTYDKLHMILTYDKLRELGFPLSINGCCGLCLN